MNFAFSKPNYLFLKFLLILLLSQTFKPEAIDNSLIKAIVLNKDKLIFESNDKIEQNNEKFNSFKFYKIDLSQIDNINTNKRYNFIRINVRLKDEQALYPLQIYINKTLNDFMQLNDDNELFMVDYNLNEKNPTIYLPKKYYETNKFFYFFIQTEINVEYIYEIELIENENILIKDDTRFNILFKPGKISIYYDLPKNGIRSGFLSVGLLISGILEEQNKLSVNVFCEKRENIIGKNYPYFINGVGALIDSQQLVKCKNKRILIEINNNLNKQIYAEFTTQYIYSKGVNNYEIEKNIYTNDVFTSIAIGENNNNTYKQCFYFMPILKEKKTSSFYLFVRTISSNLYINISNKKYIKGSLTKFSDIIDFKSNHSITTNICFTNRNNYDAGIQLQILEIYDNLNINNYYIFTKNPILPLINGFASEGTINALNKMIFKVNVKTFYSSINSNKYKDKIIKYHLDLRDLSKMKLLHLRCKIFKISKYLDLNTEKEENKICEIVDNISYEINNNIYLAYNYPIENLLYYEEFVLAECNNEGDKNCKFRIEVNVQDNYDTFPTQLFYQVTKNIIIDNLNYNYYNSIVKSNIDTYKITISNKLKKGTKIYFLLYMFSGDADMAIYDYNEDNKMDRVIQDAFYSCIGKEKLLLYEIKKNNKNIYFREILLKITGLSSGYYSIKYYIISDDNREKLSSLPIHEFYLEKISINKEKYYSLGIQDFYLDKISNEFYITINAINCIIEASLMKKTYIGREMQILY